jgi:hypothetical protein
MGGQGCCNHLLEMKVRMLLDKCKKCSLRVKDMSVFVVETVAVCIERRACKNQ